MINFAIVDPQTDEVLDVRYGAEAARLAINERGSEEDIYIQPIMIRSEYESKHLDFRGEIDGKPWLLYMDINGATTYGPVVLLDYWGKWSGDVHHTPINKFCYV